MRNKRFVFLFFFFSFFVLGSYCSARVLEVDYPTIPGVPAMGSNAPLLPIYINYLFNFGVLIGFLATFVSLIWGGFVYITSVVSPDKKRDARGRIVSGISGMIFLLLSYIIITTINPNLSILSIDDLKENPGIYLIGGGQRKPCSFTGVSDISKINPLPTDIEYKCLTPADPPVVISFYQQPYYSGGVSKVELICNNKLPISGQSFNFRFKNTGVYLHINESCPIEAVDSIFTRSLSELGWYYENRIKSIKIVNDPTNYLYYGATVHSERDFRGKCLQIPPLLTNVGCSNNCATSSCGYNIPGYNPSSITIYRFYADPSIIGSVTFYRRSFYNSDGGYLRLNNGDILYKGGVYQGWYWKSLKDLEFTNVPEEDKECIKWDIEGKCVQRKSPSLAEGNTSSIKIEGNYLVFLYDSSKGDICQLFPTPDDINKEGPKQLKWEYISQDGRTADYVFIIPVKDLKQIF